MKVVISATLQTCTMVCNMPFVRTLLFRLGEATHFEKHVQSRGGRQNPQRATTQRQPASEPNLTRARRLEFCAPLAALLSKRARVEIPPSKWPAFGRIRPSFGRIRPACVRTLPKLGPMLANAEPSLASIGQILSNLLRHQIRLKSGQAKLNTSLAQTILCRILHDLGLSSNLHSLATPLVCDCLCRRIPGTR